MLKTVFYPSDNDFGYIKATVRSEDVSALLEMGWRATQAEIHDEVLEKERQDKTPDPESGKAGDGVPGSEEWHRNALSSMEDKDEVAAYASRCGVEIDKRGSLDTVKDKAVAAIMATHGNSE